MALPDTSPPSAPSQTWRANTGGGASIHVDLTALGSASRPSTGSFSLGGITFDVTEINAASIEIDESGLYVINPTGVCRVQLSISDIDPAFRNDRPWSLVGVSDSDSGSWAIGLGSSSSSSLAIQRQQGSGNVQSVQGGVVARTLSRTGSAVRALGIASSGAGRSFATRLQESTPPSDVIAQDLTLNGPGSGDLGTDPYSSDYILVYWYSASAVAFTDLYLQQDR